jgi:anaerobic ribonucleoside-triphosphate reductase activating protein
VLGPFKRFGIWTQGCLKKCNGCISPNSRPLDEGFLIKESELIKKIISAEVEGITVSGGEPFLQAEALVDIITGVRKLKNIGVIVYTGYKFSELKSSNCNCVTALLKATDLLIDGEFVESLNDGLSLRGSSNQNICLLTDRYREQLNLYGMSGRKIELFVNERGECRYYGIPPCNIREFVQENS